MAKLHLYHVTEKYIAFLHGADKRVQMNKGEKRPYVGIVLMINGHNYFVPMESPKPNHANVKSGIHLMKIADGKYGMLGFNNMIPVPQECLLDFDINKEPDDNYRELLKNQIIWCNTNKNEIYGHAKKTYNMVLEGRSEFHMKICCDFKKLEKASKKYNPDYKK